MGKPVNFTPPGFSPANSVFPTCPECGNLHPATAPGQCPVAMGKTEEGKKVAEFMKKATELLTVHEDKDRLLEMLNKTIQAWQLQWAKKKINKPRKQ